MAQTVRSSVPALVLVGAMDPVTPVASAERVASHLPNCRVLVLPARSHGDVDRCVWGLIDQFVVGRQAKALETA